MSPRPYKCRKLNSNIIVDYFKPRSIPMCELEEVILELDEYEAIKLADLEDMYQADAAEKMGISRQTFGNIIKSAHKKIADAIINGKAIRVEEPINDSTFENAKYKSVKGHGHGKRFRGGKGE